MSPYSSSRLYIINSLSSHFAPVSKHNETIKVEAWLDNHIHNTVVFVTPSLELASWLTGSTDMYELFLQTQFPPWEGFVVSS